MMVLFGVVEFQYVSGYPANGFDGNLPLLSMQITIQR